MTSDPRPPTPGRRAWRLQREAPPAPRWVEGEHDLGTPWLHLQYEHTAVSMLEPAARQDLAAHFSELERLCMLHEELGKFYRENFLTPQGESLPATPLPPAAFSDMVWHFATLQVRFAELAFRVLELGRFANAPANRGWMNLFRTWGRSPRFDAVLSHLAPTLPRDFVRFHRWYLRGYSATIDDAPVPHPWDSQVRRLDTRVMGAVSREAPGQQTWQAVQSMLEYLPGSFLDAGVQEVRPPEEHNRAAQRTGEADRNETSPSRPVAFDENGYLAAPGAEATPMQGDRDEPPPHEPGPPFHRRP